MKGQLVRLAWATGAATAPSLAAAQAGGAGPMIAIEPVLDRDDVAGTRVEPAYQPQPVRMGPVLARPGLSVVTQYLSNTFNRPDARAAAVVSVMPSLELSTDLPRHQLGLSASGTVRRFSQHQTENSEEFALAGDGRYDFGAHHDLRASAEFARRIEPRSTAGSIPDAAEPASYDRRSAELAMNLDFAAVRLVPALRYERLDYRDVALSGGGTADMHFRDTRSVRADLRIEYRLTGMLSAFATAAREDVDSPSPTAVLRRDAHDPTLIAGLRGAVSPVMSGEIGIGYRRRAYAQPELRDFRGLTFRADLQWYVTPLLTLRAQADRSFRNSGNPAVGAILADRFAFSAFHDPLCNLRLAAMAELERGRFDDVRTRTWRKTLQLRAQFRVNRTIAFGGFLGLVRQDVSGPPVVVPFTAFTAGLGMTITP